MLPYVRYLSVAGIRGNHIITPFFINGDVNGDRYMHLLRNEIVTVTVLFLPNVNNPLATAECIWFQSGTY